MNDPRLGRRPVLTPRLLVIDRSDSWARSSQGLIRLGLSFAQQWALAPLHLNGIARQIRMIEAAGYMPIDPRMLESLLSEFARTVRLMHACRTPPTRFTESPWIVAGQTIDDRSPG